MTSKKVFISYNHGRQDWVRRYLEPVLQAVGCEVLVDYRCFGAGRNLVGQMDHWQDQADFQILLITHAYLQSAACQHELNRALALDPQFQTGTVIPIKAESGVTLPEAITQPNPLYLSLVDHPGDEGNWGLLTKALGVEFNAYAWLRARDRIWEHLLNNQSVNLVTKDKSWRSLVDHLCADKGLRLSRFDFQTGQATRRHAALSQMLRAAGLNGDILNPADDLVHFAEQMDLQGKRGGVRQAWLHFHMINRRDCFDFDFSSTIRNHIQDARNLVLLIHSNQPMASFIEQDDELSAIVLMQVEL